MKTKKSIYVRLISIFIITIGWISTTSPAKSFIPYVYIPEQKELEKTSLDIGKTAIQILQFGQAKEAAYLAKLGLILKPNDYRLWSILGEAQRRTGSLKEAGISLNKAKLLEPKKAELWFAEATVALEQKNPNKALPLLIRGLQLNNKNALGYFQLGNCRLMKNQFELSLKAYKNAIKIKPTFWEALNNRGIIEFVLGKKQKASKTWQEVLKIKKNSEPMLALGAVLNFFNPGNAKSIELAKEALKKNPNYVNASYQKEQLWGEKLIEATSQLFSLPGLKEDIEKALKSSDINN